MKVHIGVDADSGLVHTVTGTAVNVHDVTQAHAEERFARHGSFLVCEGVNSGTLYVPVYIG